MLVNLHVHVRGTNHLIPEVNSSQKLDHKKSFFDRPQAVQCTTESTCLQGNHPAFLFVDCCFDITLNKHSITIANNLDNLSLDNKTVVVSYTPRRIGYKLD